MAAVVLLHLWKRNNLISIFGGTILYMFLVQAVSLSDTAAKTGRKMCFHIFLPVFLSLYAVPLVQDMDDLRNAALIAEPTRRAPHSFTAGALLEGAKGMADTASMGISFSLSPTQ